MQLFKFISYPPDRGDLPVGAAAGLFPDALDMHVHRACISDVVIAPDPVEKLFAGKDSAR